MRHRRASKFPPKLRDTLRSNLKAMELMDGGRNLEITQRFRTEAEDLSPKRRQTRMEGVDIDAVHKGRKRESSVNDEIADLKFSGKLWRNNRGAVRLDNGAFLKYGVGPNGASDWIGYRTLTITPEMVGRTIAQFAVIEAKRPGENARPDQSEFIDTVLKAGGVGGVAHSGAEAGEILK